MDMESWFVVPPTRAAEYLGISTKTLAWYRRTGKGPSFYRMGHRTVRYRIGDLDDWLADNRVPERDHS